MSDRFLLASRCLATKIKSIVWRLMENIKHVVQSSETEFQYGSSIYFQRFRSIHLKRNGKVHCSEVYGFHVQW